ncbi:MAG: hypothetical protein KAI24_20480 [Planctomycetes bacterium]|nr:hypothetical protein [Planctomycetota bacterium]
MGGDQRTAWRPLVWVLALCYLATSWSWRFGLRPDQLLEDAGLPRWLAGMLPDLVVLAIVAAFACRILGQRRLRVAARHQWRDVAWTVVLVPPLVVLGCGWLGAGIDVAAAWPQFLHAALSTLVSSMLWLGLLMLVVRRGGATFGPTVALLGALFALENLVAMLTSGTAQAAMRMCGFAVGFAVTTFVYTAWVAVMLRRLAWNLVTVLGMLTAVAAAMTILLPPDHGDQDFYFTESLLAGGSTLLAYVAAMILATRWQRSRSRSRR